MFVPSREGGCLTGVSESLLWNRLVKSMAKGHWVSTRGVSGVSKAIYGSSIGKIGQCIIVNMPILSEMLIGLT